MWTFDFHTYDLVYSYKRKEFKRILETKLCDRIGQLLLIY